MGCSEAINIYNSGGDGRGWKHGPEEKDGEVMSKGRRRERNKRRIEWRRE